MPTEELKWPMKIDKNQPFPWRLFALNWIKIGTDGRETICLAPAEGHCSRTISAFLDQRFVELAPWSRVDGGPAMFTVILQTGYVGAKVGSKLATAATSLTFVAYLIICAIGGNGTEGNEKHKSNGQWILIELVNSRNTHLKRRVSLRLASPNRRVAVEQIEPRWLLCNFVDWKMPHDQLLSEIEKQMSTETKFHV